MPYIAVTDWHEEGLFVTVNLPGFRSKAGAMAVAKHQECFRIDREQGKVSLYFVIDKGQLSILLRSISSDFYATACNCVPLPDTPQTRRPGGVEHGRAHSPN